MDRKRKTPPPPAPSPADMGPSDEELDREIAELQRLKDLKEERKKQKLAQLELLKKELNGPPKEHLPAKPSPPATPAKPMTATKAAPPTPPKIAEVKGHRFGGNSTHSKGTTTSPASAVPSPAELPPGTPQSQKSTPVEPSTSVTPSPAPETPVQQLAPPAQAGSSRACLTRYFCLSELLLAGCRWQQVLLGTCLQQPQPCNDGDGQGVASRRRCQGSPD